MPRELGAEVADLGGEIVVLPLQVGEAVEDLLEQCGFVGGAGGRAEKGNE